MAVSDDMMKGKEPDCYEEGRPRLYKGAPGQDSLSMANCRYFRSTGRESMSRTNHYDIKEFFVRIGFDIRSKRLLYRYSLEYQKRGWVITRAF